MSAVNARSAFFLTEADRHANDNGKIVTLVTSLLGASTPVHAEHGLRGTDMERFDQYPVFVQVAEDVQDQAGNIEHAISSRC